MLRSRASRLLLQLLFISFLTAGLATTYNLALPKDDRAAELIRVLRDGEKEKAAKLIKRGEDINVRDDYGWTPLMYAVLGNNAEAIRDLLAKGADANAQDKDGVTPLIASILLSPSPFMLQYIPENDKRAAEIPLLLVEKGADPNLADNEGNPPLIYAAIGSHAPLVEALLAKGANPNRADKYGRTALYFISNPDKAAEWAPERGAISSRRRAPYQQPDESAFTPQYAAQVAAAREQATVQPKQVRAKIAELLKKAGALEPDNSGIQSAGRPRLDARPRRFSSFGPNDPLSQVIHTQMMSGKKNARGSRYVLLVRVGSDGIVKQALIMTGMPNGFSERLRKAAMKLRYQPAVKDGQPVEDWETIVGVISVSTTFPGKAP
jgi:hypothetical protein